MAILLLAPFSPDVLHVNYFCTKTITDQKANLLQIKNQIYHRSKIKSITDQKPNLSQIKTKSITDQKPNLSQTKHQIYHRSKTKSMTDQKPNLWQIKNQIYYRSKPNLSPIKTKSITDQKPNLLQIKNKIYYRSDKEILTTLVSVCWSNILWLNKSSKREGDSDKKISYTSWYKSVLCSIKLCLHTAIYRADFVSWWMWFNGSPTKVSLYHDCILLPSYTYITCTKIRNRPD